MTDSIHKWLRHSSLRLIVTALSVSAFFCQSSTAQQSPQHCSQIKYPHKLTDHREYRLDRIAGQAVYGEVADRGEFVSANGVCVALFSMNSKQVPQVVSTGTGGQFQFRDLPPGRYILLAALTPLHEVSAALRVSRKWRATRLLLRLRAKEDPRKSFLTIVANPALRQELLAMLERDQAIRNEEIKSGIAHPDKILAEREAAIDSQNTARLRQVVSRYGWPGPELTGLDGAEAAFLLVQHAEPAFHKAMLPHVKQAYRQGRLSPNNYALFIDRVLTREGKPQLYGTQLMRWNEREPVLYPILDEANVDKRRAALRLGTLSEYLEGLKRIYFPPQ